MVCEACKQEQATVHLTEIVNGQMNELHLCEACANQKGAQVENQLGLADLLLSLADVGKSQELEHGAAGRACPSCGMTYEDFRKVGRLGCAECYKTFKRGLATLLRRLHGSSRHFGKAPVSLTSQRKPNDELARLKRELERAVEMEEFEQAAHLRDRIRQLERESPPGKPRRD